VIPKLSFTYQALRRVVHDKDRGQMPHHLLLRIRLQKMVSTQTRQTMPLNVDIAPPQTTTDTEYVVATNVELERPYRVIIENDDVTPMDFVVLVLLTIFELSYERAEEVMYQAHLKGRAYVATLPFEEAQQRVYAAQSLARTSGYPLSFYLEPDV
jgi:ATP-dependent Clp protease adaptor protein ClpS